MELFRLLGTIAINNDDANKAIGETTEKASKSESKMSAAFKKIGTAVAAAFAVDKIVDFGKACVESAASVKAMNSQFEQTFGELGGQASDAISKVAEESNILDTRLKGVGTSIYAFAKTTGMESTEALGMMERALKVTADSAAYYDRSLEETSESLKSFLKGNFENDAALGLSCTETTRNAAANRLYGKSFIELSESQKQLTLLQMVEDANALSGAMGQASREGEGWENVTGNLKEAWTQFQAKIGTPLLNALVPVIQKITNGISDLGEKVGGFIDRMTDAENGAKNMKDMLEKVFGSDAVGTMTSTIQSIKDTLSPLLDAFRNLGGAIAENAEGSTFFQDAFSVMASGISMVWNSVGQPIFNAISAGINWLAENWEPISSAISTSFGVLWDYCQTIWSTIGQPIWDMISFAISQIASLFSENMPAIMAFFQEAVAGISDTWENHLKPIFEAIGAFLNDYVKPAFEFVFNAVILPIVENVFGFIGKLWKNTLKPVFDGICDFLLGVFTGDWEKAFDGILKVTTGIFKGILEAIQMPLETAKDVVNKAIEFIKDKFDFDWKFPELKMPHFTVNGEFSLNPPSIPEFGIEWYKKGGILNEPTAFGINPNSGKLMVGGEAGAEAVAPISTLQSYVAEAVASQNQGLIAGLDNLLYVYTTMLINAISDLKESGIVTLDDPYKMLKLLKEKEAILQKAGKEGAFA